MKYDIVYILNEDIESEELRYSLRSVCENFEFNKIWFYGGCPKWAKPNHHISFKQKGYNKLDRVRSTISAICSNEKITSNFYLFNDDFFILAPYNQEIQFCNGTLLHLADEIEKRNNKNSFYCDYLRYTSQVLSQAGYDTLSYACHMPLLVNKEKAIDTLLHFPINTLFRSIYGNHHSIKGELIDDVKIIDLEQIPEEDWFLASTSDESFVNGKVGEYIREKFPKPCKYELKNLSKLKIFNII